MRVVSLESAFVITLSRFSGIEIPQAADSPACPDVFYRDGFNPGRGAKTFTRRSCFPNEGGPSEKASIRVVSLESEVLMEMQISRIHRDFTDSNFHNDLILPFFNHDIGTNRRNPRESVESA